MKKNLHLHIQIWSHLLLKTVLLDNLLFLIYILSYGNSYYSYYEAVCVRIDHSRGYPAQVENVSLKGAVS